MLVEFWVMCNFFIGYIYVFDLLIFIEF